MSACGKRPLATPEEQRKGGGYRQIEERESKAAKANVEQSELSKYLVLKPSPLGTPPPLWGYVYTEACKVFKIIQG